MSKPPANSSTNTLIVPQTGTDPATLYQAADKVLRVIVRNVGGPVLFIAYDSNTLAQPPGLAGMFQLPPGASEVFVLMPRQGLYAGAAGAGGMVSIAVSEAIPLTTLES